MEELIKTFHIDAKIIFAQAVNFSIVFFVVWYFAFKPLVEIMKKREATVAKSLRDAKKLEESLEKAEKDYKTRIQEAKSEASALLLSAQKESESMRKDMVERAKSEVEKVIREAKIQLNEDREQMIVSAQRELGQIVVSALEQIIPKTISEEIDRKLIEQTLKELELKR